MLKAALSHSKFHGLHTLRLIGYLLLLKGKHIVFEWGMGGSTVFFGEKSAKKVISVES